MIELENILKNITWKQWENMLTVKKRLSDGISQNNPCNSLGHPSTSTQYNYQLHLNLNLNNFLSYIKMKS